MATAEYDRHDRKLRILGVHTSMGGHSNRQFTCLDTVVHYDTDGVRQIFQALYLCGYRSRSYVHLCGRRNKSYRQSLSQILCGCLPRGCDYRARLHHLLYVCILAALGGGGCIGSNAGVDVYRRIAL